MKEPKKKYQKPDKNRNKYTKNERYHRKPEPENTLKPGPEKPVPQNKNRPTLSFGRDPR